MKNLMNNVDNVLTESLDGFAAAHADIVALGAELLSSTPEEFIAIITADMTRSGKVIKDTGIRAD